MSVRFSFSRTRPAHVLAFAFACVSLSLIGMGSAAAQNIVPNPNLDTALPPWTQFLSSAPDPTGAGSVTWVASPDIDNAANSGSAATVIDTSTPAANAASGISQCVSFAPTTVNFFNYGASVLVPTTTAGDQSVNATVEVRIFSDASCTNFVAGGTQGRTITAAVHSNTTWYALGDTNFAVSPAATAQSAEIRAYLRETAIAPTAQSYKVYFDKFRLVLNNTTPVRLQEFGVE